MKRDFWLERWQRNQIGFHEDEVNPYLPQFWPQLTQASDSKVFVPLCGKSVDMKWLSQQGHKVIGVEFSEIAAQAFFKENGYTAHASSNGKFMQYEANNIRILCGDFFELSREDMLGVTAVYDRASVVALPLDMRQEYVKKLASILPAKTKMLLVTFEYPQVEMQGPPFSIAADEVTFLYQQYAEINLLARVDILAENPRFQQRGLTRLHESIYQLNLR